MSNNETAVLLIVYDLNEEDKRPPIVERITRQWPEQAKLSESAYAIETKMSPTAVANKLSDLIDENDTLHVITQTRPFVGTEDDAVEWLKDHLPVEQEELDDQEDPEKEE